MAKNQRVPVYGYHIKAPKQPVRRFAPRREKPEYYDIVWSRLSRMVRNAEPTCRECAKRGITTAADEVDHIIPIAERPDLRLSIDNLQPLCKSCHGAKTMRENRAAGLL